MRGVDGGQSPVAQLQCATASPSKAVLVAPGSGTRATLSGLEPRVQLEAFPFGLWLGQKSSWPRPGLLGPRPDGKDNSSLRDAAPQTLRGAIKPHTAPGTEPGTPGAFPETADIPPVLRLYISR